MVRRLWTRELRRGVRRRQVSCALCDSPIGLPPCAVTRPAASRIRESGKRRQARRHSISSGWVPRIHMGFTKGGSHGDDARQVGEQQRGAGSGGGLRVAQDTPRLSCGDRRRHQELRPDHQVREGWEAILPEQVCALDLEAHGARSLGGSLDEATMSQVLDGIGAMFGI